MQGTFENLDENEESEENGENEETNTGSPKRPRLDAMANVPWRSLAPSNDRETQQRMRDHYGQEAKYDSLMEDKKVYVPKVSPYPEGPDAVFPGTPCYKLTVNGRLRHVFVLDPGSPGYDDTWDGQCRPQTAARWIVPHFIYRDALMVSVYKNMWKQVYTYNSTQIPLLNPPQKDMYDSRAMAVIMPALPGAAIVYDQFESYYVRGVPNGNPAAPSIEDPLLKAPFNSNLKFVGYTSIKPFPYHQDPGVFPQKVAPTPVYRPHIAPVIPAAAGRALRPRAAGPAAAGPGAVGAGRRGGRGNVQEQVPPHPSLLDVSPAINLRTGREGVDWISVSADNLEISMDVIKAACEQGEELDYAFALSMQGLRGTNLSAVWACIDPEYDVSDRSMVLAQFVKTYMEKFYQSVSVVGSSDVEEVVHEALRMHEEFCKGWVSRHHRTLSSEIASASEALIGLFMGELKSVFPDGLNVTRVHMSRYLRRHPNYCGEFALCLYHYMTSMEHMRGNRNPSYKAMNNERVAQITSLKKMGEMLFDVNKQRISADLENIDNDLIIFDWRFVDWHFVAAQMPQHHKEFDGYANNFSLFRTRTGGRGNAFPPWQQMRRV